MGRKTQPLSVSEMLADEGVKPTIRWRDKVYRVGHDTGAALARFEGLIRARVRSDARAEGQFLSAPEAETNEARVQALLDRRHYATFRPGWFDVLRAADGSGVALFLLALVQPDHPELTTDDVRAMAREEPAQVADALEVAAPTFFDAAADSVGADEDATAEIKAQLRAAIVAAIRTPMPRRETSKPSTPHSAASPGASPPPTSPGSPRSSAGGSTSSPPLGEPAA